jgi:hypothetical protein
VNLYIGKTVARCKHCQGTDWLLLEPAGRFSILSDVECAACRMKHTYADLVLQLPLLLPDLSSAGEEGQLADS